MALPPKCSEITHYNHLDFRGELPPGRIVREGDRFEVWMNECVREIVVYIKAIKLKHFPEGDVRDIVEAGTLPIHIRGNGAILTSELPSDYGRDGVSITDKAPETLHIGQHSFALVDDENEKVVVTTYALIRATVVQYYGEPIKGRYSKGEDRLHSNLRKVDSVTGTIETSPIETSPSETSHKGNDDAVVTAVPGFEVNSNGQIVASGKTTLSLKGPSPSGKPKKKQKKTSHATPDGGTDDFGLPMVDR